MTVEVGNPRELSRVRAYLTREPETVEWIAEYVKSQDVFYDIGANIGLYSIFAAKLHRGDLKVYSFEPESQNYASLNRNVYLNGLSDAITTLCMAVSDSSDQFPPKIHLPEPTCRNSAKTPDPKHGQPHEMRYMNNNY